MIKFLLKGILRDSTRSRLPLTIVTLGVALTVLLSGYMRGAMGDIIDQNARFDTGHLKILTKAYHENQAQQPLDLALLGVDSLKQALAATYPEVEWVSRLRFGGLLDVPDAEGNTRGQGPAIGLALELLEPKSQEAERLNIAQSLEKGRLPETSSEVLIGYKFANKLNVEVGDKITFMGSTMYGSMAFKNLTVCGTVRFGSAVMDKGMLLMDIREAQQILDMHDGATELLGYLDDGVYVHHKAASISQEITAQGDPKDDFSLYALPLKAQNNLGGYIDYANAFGTYFVGIFVFIMSLVLWNTGLLAGLRRYQEFGIRLALGEAKGQIYRSLLLEALLVGVIGSVFGTLVGLGGVWYLQVVGIDISDMMPNSNMIFPSVIRAKLSFSLLYLGFIPGLLATLLGNALSGYGIYKRETAQLFKELEV